MSVMEVYMDMSLEEPLSLEDFLARLQAGEFGVFTVKEVMGFLRDVEAHMLENIELKVNESPVWADEAARAAEETRQLVARLRAQIKPGPGIVEGK